MLKAFKGRDVLSIKELDRQQIELIFRVTKKLEPIAIGRSQRQILKNSILATLFFQASTRTRLSFESAMHRLGGAVLGFANAGVSRAGDVYGETIDDTARMIQFYADAVAMRHPTVGLPRKLAESCNVPVINAGDGYGESAEHPTQALLDLFTIFKHRGKIDDTHVILWGDMNQRTMQSLALGLAKFERVKISAHCPDSLRFPPGTEEELRRSGVELNYVSFEKVAAKADVIYIIGPKKTRAELPTEPEFKLNRARLAQAKRSLMILHPLPRLDELAPDVDATTYSKYFEQPLHGVAVRMALLTLVLGKASSF
jgi:aspartate carbamoyltransferase catalytic subunit